MSASEASTVIKCVLSNNLAGLRQHLLARPETTEETDREGRTALLNAAIENRLEAAKILIEEGAQVNARDRAGRTALHFAAQGHHEELALLLIKSGADLEAEDAHGNTPLGRATFESRGRGELVSLLLEAGADPSHRNKHGKSPLDLAQSISNFDVARFFR